MTWKDISCDTIMTEMRFTVLWFHSLRKELSERWEEMQITPNWLGQTSYSSKNKTGVSILSEWLKDTKERGFGLYLFIYRAH